MTPDTLYRLAPPLIALQFLAFAWRVNREIKVADADRQDVIPLPDVINIMSLFATVGCVIILPMVTDQYLWLSRMVLGGAYVLIAFYPMMIAAHFRLWRRDGTQRAVPYRSRSPYVNRQELVTSLLSVVVATVAAGYLRTHV